ncbi:hypothetical protein WEI85_38060 [Actinomycetes bacterium KLBMP 9797]
MATPSGDKLIRNDPQKPPTLFRILSRVVHHWASPLGQPDGKGVPFKVLLLCDRDEEAALLRQEIIGAVHNVR